LSAKFVPAAAIIPCCCHHPLLLLLLPLAAAARRAAEAVRRRGECRLELHPYIQLLLSRPLPPHIADAGWDIQVSRV
jgi:hypothetical protein